MTEYILGLVSSYGALIIFASTFLSCLAIPMPSSLMMLAGGAFAAAGDLALWSTAAAALAGAVAGDQAGFNIGRLGGNRVTRAFSKKPEREKLIQRARDTVKNYGGIGVFFSTWLLAPLGPWVNLLAGVAGMNWLRFTLWDVAGETIWVTVYTGLGFLFADEIVNLAGLLGNWSGFLVAGFVVIVLGRYLWKASKSPAKRKASAN